MYTYKAISLKQPWASLIADGTKTIETRKWKTNYRGDIVVCSSQHPKIEPWGKALCVIELYDIRPMTKEDQVAACYELYDGAYSWLFKNVRVLQKPVPVKGQLNIFTLSLPQKLSFAG